QSEGQLACVSPAWHAPSPHFAALTHTAIPLPWGSSAQLWPEGQVLPMHTHGSESTTRPVVPAARLILITGCTWGAPSPGSTSNVAATTCSAPVAEIGRGASTGRSPGDAMS